MSEDLPTRIAVVHDWLVDFAGSERVLAEILSCLPQADLFSLVDHMPDAERAPLGGYRARTTFLQHMPGIANHLAWYLPLMPFAIEQLDLTNYHLVISSSHAVAKGVIVSPDALHLSYVHSPMRYAWDLQFEYLEESRIGGRIRRSVLRCLLHRLRQWDRLSASGVDGFIANSHFISRRILKAYRRESEVIYPPIDTEYFTPGAGRDDYYVTVSRLLRYKRIDLLVDAFGRMRDRRLVVVGDGPELAPLKSRATPNVEFTGRLPAGSVREHLQRARAFLFSAVEDFGIAPVEAMACGTPVIALRKGGAAETVAGLDSAVPTGVFFEVQSAESISVAVRTFEDNTQRISADACRARALRFSAERFRTEFSSFVTRHYSDWLQPQGR